MSGIDRKRRDSIVPRKKTLGHVEPDPALSQAINEKSRHDASVTEDDLLEAKEFAETLSLEATRDIMTQIYKIHKRDRIFPQATIERMEEFLDNDDVFENPEKHNLLIQEMKVEAALITNNSPYAEVRSVVDNHDDPNLPCSTIRAWVIGILFSVIIAFVNGFFGSRQPRISLPHSVAQLLAYPLGKCMEKALPDVGVTVLGVRHTLNPGPFNRKEHMLITIMAGVSESAPYTNLIIWVQYLPRFFNQPWALSWGYQALIALSTNFIGYSLAGLCRRFLVYPSYCMWPQSLVTISLNSAFHSESNPSVLGPFGKLWRMSRIKFFLVALAAMFVWFWVPNTLFTALGYFAWMTWIAPNNRHLATITGSMSGLGYNPFPTFDWNVATLQIDPLMVPLFTTLNTFAGAFISGFLIMGLYYTNVWGTGYLPIISNTPWDNTAARYNVSRILNKHEILDVEKYHAYSPPYLSAGFIVTYFVYFSVYASIVTYAVLYHRNEIALGFRNLVNSFRPSKRGQIEKRRLLDVHNRLMQAYDEVPEWWYLIVLVVAVVFGCAAITAYPTYTSVGAIFFGIVLCLVFVVPVGIVKAMTGVEVTLEVLAELIGGSWVQGNALDMCFFKTYGYVTCSHALSFTHDLKLAHYMKIKPKLTFFAQMVPTLVSTFIYIGILQFQVHIKDVCTHHAPFNFYCPYQNSFFTAAVFWGTVGPKRLWGPGGTYTITLIGFPLGIVIVLTFHFLGKRWPRSAFLRNAHPVLLLSGGQIWTAYNISYITSAIYPAVFSWVFIKKRYLSLWSKYNFVLSAAFSAGIAISALVQFFTIAYSGKVSLNWWGNTIVGTACESMGQCLHKTLAPGEHFGPGPGEFP